MCEFKSGIIFKNRVVLSPTYNDSHSALLRKLGIEDTRENAIRKFVRAELIPPNDERDMDISKWKFKVDQDIVPEWFENDPQRYEDEFRDVVNDWVKENTIVVAGHSWLRIKEEDDNTYYLLNGTLKSMGFGKNNNYAKSDVRKYLQNSKIVDELKAEFGDRLVPTTVCLTSMDGLKDYGNVEGDILSLMDIDLYRECRENITCTDAFWLATPDSTPSGFASDFVHCVDSDGLVDYGWYYVCDGVRPFFILKP